MQIVNRSRYFVLAFAMGCSLGNGRVARAAGEMSLHQLIESSDFVGVVVADPNVIATNGSTKTVIISNAEPFKGALTHITPTQFSYIHAAKSESSPTPTWFAERAEYLVFLKQGSKQGEPYWTTRAAYRVEYQPDASGVVSGRVFNRAMAIDDARKLIQKECSTGLPVPSAETEIAPLLALGGHEPPTTYEDTVKRARTLIAGIKQGTTRGDIEKIFRQQDGGAMGSVNRYYVGNNVMIHVPYDTTGGLLSPKNRLDGEVTITRSMMHYD